MTEISIKTINDVSSFHFRYFFYSVVKNHFFKTCYIILAIMLLTSLFFPFPVHSEIKLPENQKNKSEPIIIKSNNMEVDNNLKVITFKGDVKAIENDFTIGCQKMRVYFDRFPSQKKAEDYETKIIKIISTGNVIINNIQGGKARAAEAIFYQESEKMVLTGNPVVRQGDNFIEGDRITFFLKENRSIVESKLDKKAKATIFPKRVKR